MLREEMAAELIRRHLHWTIQRLRQRAAPNTVEQRDWFAD
jgi:DNA-binding GntR family transcriptional regulator